MIKCMVHHFTLRLNIRNQLKEIDVEDLNDGKTQA